MRCSRPVIICILLLTTVSAIAQQPDNAATPEVRKEMIDGILARPEFAGAKETWLDRLGERVARTIAAIENAINHAIRSLLEWLFGNMESSGGSSRLLSRSLAVVLIILFLLLLAYVVSRIRFSRLRERYQPAPNSEDAGPESARRALDEAARLAGLGDFRPALRMVYLAALLLLDEREFIRFDHSGTNWEYLAALRPHPELQKTLRPVTMTFDRKWYGHETANEDDYRSFMDAYRRVEAFEVEA